MQLKIGEEAPSDGANKQQRRIISNDNHKIITRRKDTTHLYLSWTWKYFDNLCNQLQFPKAYLG